ncbi:hypothetical protein [Bifidobacterium sp. ESL0745]|uniref:variant leucine-rich repeat-containing protein n=1 Tax=Bifidobacterium sp. ESL0745 TaxID=2983226 RepID=UPI0023F90A4C|nr:hypothetical protein [Bifidobacterium sp. ESL0745]MDF7665544.1 hypothetical protein [Bifidobacterium sp. ESL0745]
MNAMVDYDTAVATVQDPNADPVMLAKIAYENPDFGANVAVNPRAYLGLKRWLAQFGDNRARQTLKAMGFDVPQQGVSPREAGPQATTQEASQNLHQAQTQDPYQTSDQCQTQAAFQVAAQRQYQNQAQAHAPGQASPAANASYPATGASYPTSAQQQNPGMGYYADQREAQTQYRGTNQYDLRYDPQSDSKFDSQPDTSAAPAASIAPADSYAHQTPVTTNAYGYTAEQALDPHTDQMTIAKIAQYAPELRPCLARNPNTYPELLEWLAQLHDPAIDAALAIRQ